MNVVDIVFHTWPWYVSGFLIGMVMLCLIYFGKVFGMSSNLSTLCSMTGIGKKVPFFDFDWKSKRWNLLVVLGAMLGGFVANRYMDDLLMFPLTQKQLHNLHN
jgi:uncharacterized membrane protein YadS